MYSRYILYNSDEEGGNRPTPYEANHYHDLLEEMLGSEWIKTVPEGIRDAMFVVRDTLCWTLGHDHNPAIETNLRKWAEAYHNSNDNEADNIGETFDN
jgi:hypothetical protein